MVEERDVNGSPEVHVLGVVAKRQVLRVLLGIGHGDHARLVKRRQDGRAALAPPVAHVDVRDLGGREVRLGLDLKAA
ncbi:hypothetical protein D3C86_2076380 [compost metagenome]